MQRSVITTNPCIYASSGMKKPTNPLHPDIRYGGFLVLPILAAFEGQSNLVTPSNLAFRKGLAEPLASWAIYAIHRMGVLKPMAHGCEVTHHTQIHDIPNKRHFIQRLSRARAKELVEHVLANAEVANTDPDFRLQLRHDRYIRLYVRWFECPG